MTDGKNAREELLKIMKDNGKSTGDIKCAVISLCFDYTDEYDMNIFLGKNEFREPDERAKYIVLKEGHTQAEFDEFLQQLDDEYWDGFGGQELYGYVMFYDESWLERHEYDGSEWWEVHFLYIDLPLKKVTCLGNFPFRENTLSKGE